jgi:hypothetical protein
LTSESEHQHGQLDTILVVVDQPTCMVHLAAVRSTDRSRETSKAPYETIFKLRGYSLPESTVSNRDTRFLDISAF